VGIGEERNTNSSKLFGDEVIWPSSEKAAIDFIVFQIFHQPIRSNMLYGSLRWGILYGVVILMSMHSSASPPMWKWRDLTDNELAQWYTPADLCVLNASSRSAFPQDIRARDCYHHSKGSRRMFCGIGMGNNNYPCYGPFGETRPSFKRGLEGFTDASSKPLLEAAQRLLDSHSSLLLLGDSTMRQKLQALQCELSREDPRIRFHGNLFGIVPCDTLLRIYFPDKRELQVYGISLGPRATECIQKHFPDHKLTETELERMIQEDATLGIAYHASKLMDMINHEQNRSITVIANTGLWYNIEQEFRQVIPGVLQWLSQIRQRQRNHHGNSLQNRVAWHETLRQHWISHDQTGYFEQTIVDAQETNWKTQNLEAVTPREFMVPHCCHSIHNATDWRNDIVHTLIQANATYSKSIPILPMADITRDIPDLHTCNPYFKHDCTHYCFTPMLYQPLWHQIRDLTMSLAPDVQ
jgi:hypothetical protein